MMTAKQLERIGRVMGLKRFSLEAAGPAAVYRPERIRDAILAAGSNPIASCLLRQVEQLAVQSADQSVGPAEGQ